MDDALRELLVEPNLVYIATLMPDGAPQLTPVWADSDGENILVNTAAGRRKHANVLRDSRVALSLVSHKDPLRMATVRGTVVEILDDSDYRHADRLAKKYMNRDRYPFRRPGERRIIFRIRPEHVFHMPEILPDPP